MVGYDPNRLGISKTDIMMAGATSGAVTRALCQPLDVVKIRFQLQSASGPDVKYRTLPQAIVRIAHEEGIRALWTGHIPAQMLSVVFGVTQFSTYEYLTRTVHDHEAYLRKELRPLVHLTCGATAGCVSTVASFPFDVVRTRFVAQSGKKKVYSGVVHAFVTISKTERFTTLFKGLFPTMIQVAPFAGAQFMFFKIFITLYTSYLLTLEEIVTKHGFPMSASLVCGSLAGLCAKGVVYPLDLTKKRMQVQGMQNWSASEKRFICSGLVDCIRKTVTNEGYRGLFKGLNVALVKAMCTSGLQFGVYEETCKALRRYHGNN